MQTQIFYISILPIDPSPNHINKTSWAEQGHTSIPSKTFPTNFENCWIQKRLGQTKSFPKKEFVLKKEICIKKRFWLKINLGSKKFLVKKSFGLKKILGPTKFGIKIFGSKIFLGPNKFGLKYFRSKKILCFKKI